MSFTAAAEGDSPLTFSWTKGEGEVKSETNVTTSSYVIGSASQEDNASRFQVTVLDKDKEPAKSLKSDVATLTVRSKDEVILWVEKFSRRAAWAVGLAAVALVVPLVIDVFVVLRRGPRKSGSPVSLRSCCSRFGVFVVAAGAYLALLEFRGRARTMEELKKELRAQGRVELAGAESLADTIKALPEALKASGQLRAMAALLVLAATLFICGTVIAAQLAGDEDPASTTTGTTSVTEEPTLSTSPAP